MNDATQSTTSGLPGNPLRADTRRNDNLAENSLRSTYWRAAVSAPDSPTSQTTATEAEPSNAPATNSTASTEPQKPSINQAFSSPFIDVKSIGLQTWPIKGMQKWEGRVTEIDGEVFSAELTPLDADDETVLVSDFRTKVLEIGESALQTGDRFYLTARPVRLRGLLVTTYSLQLRKPGNWTVKDISDIRERTRSRLEMLRDNVE